MSRGQFNNTKRSSASVANSLSSLLEEDSELPNHDTTNSSEEETSIAARAYGNLLAVLEDEGVTIANGIIVTRATDMIKDAWNLLIRNNVFNGEEYKAAALRVVDPMGQRCKHSVYFLTGRAFADMFEFATCSLEDLQEIEAGVESMRCRIRRAIRFEHRQNGKAMMILNLIKRLIGLEIEFGMSPVMLRIRLECPTGSSAPGTSGSGSRRPYTDTHRLVLLKIYRANPRATHAKKASIYNARVPESQRSERALLQEYLRMTKAGVTIAELEGRHGRS